MVAVVSLIASFSAHSASAAGPCLSYQNHRAGYYGAPSPDIYGASAKIETNNPDLCGDDASDAGDSTAWAMVHAPSWQAVQEGQSQDPNRQMWAQAGYGQFGSTNPTGAPTGFGTFAQYALKCKATNTCVTNPLKTRYATANPVGDWKYDAYRSGADHVLRMRVNNVVLLDSQYDPLGDWWESWDAQWAGEVFHYNDDMVGTPSDPTSFFDLKVYDELSASGFYTGTLTGVSTAAGRFMYTQYTPGGGGKGIRIWTN